MDLKKDLIKPFHNLWPRYNDYTEFMTDYEFNCYVSGQAIPMIIGYMNQYLVEAGSSQIQVMTCKNLAEQCRREHSVVSEPMNTKVTVVQGNNVRHNYFVPKAQQPAMILNKALTLIFPPRFLGNLMNEQLIDVNTANKWLLEYRKYLVLAYLTNSMVSPSEQVDQVWHLHMTYTQHYRATCQTLLEKEFKHTPSLGGSSEGKKYEGVYEDTLSFYKAIFLSDPPQDVWETPQQRFEMKNFEYRNLNLFRLAILYSIKVANPNFLQNSAPPVAYNQGNLKSLPPQQKKLIIRRNRRNKYYNKNETYGWRKQHHQGNYYKNEKDRRRENNEYGYYGPDYMVGGGIIIIGNPCDHHYINDPHFGDNLHHGFYDDMEPGCFDECGLDDIADFAEADADLMGDDLAEYGGEELGIDNLGEDLGINEDVAELGNDDGMDFNAEDGGDMYADNGDYGGADVADGGG